MNIRKFNEMRLFPSYKNYDKVEPEDVKKEPFELGDTVMVDGHDGEYIVAHLKVGNKYTLHKSPTNRYPGSLTVVADHNKITLVDW